MSDSRVSHSPATAKTQNIITDQLSGPGRAIGPVCVCVPENNA